MNRTKGILGTLALGCLAFNSLGCGAMGDAAARQRTMNDIKQVGLAYHMFLDDKKAPPADEKEFSAWLTAKNPDAVAAWSKLQAAGYKVYWDVNPMKLSAGAGNTVLIYPADAPTKGGLVGFADGSVRQTTAAEFNAAAKPPAK